MNAFFSGSVKGYTDLPFWYPANYLKLINGTSIDPNDPSPSYLEESIIGVKGFIKVKCDFFCSKLNAKV